MNGSGEEEWGYGGEAGGRECLFFEHSFGI